MTTEREMTLDEWCERLPAFHLVNKQLAELREKLAASEARVKELEAELEEQCRLNGMGSEREAKLIAENKKLKDALGYDWNMLEATQESLREAHQTIEDQRKLYENCTKLAQENEALLKDKELWRKAYFELAFDVPAPQDVDLNKGGFPVKNATYWKRYAAKLEQELAILKAGMEMGGT